MSYLELAFEQCVYSFTPYQLLTMLAPSRGTMQGLRATVSHSLASADRKGKCLLLPLPASCPSLALSSPHPPSLRGLLPSFPRPPTPPHPPSLPSPFPSLSLQLFLCCLQSCQCLAKLCSGTGLASEMPSS